MRKRINNRIYNTDTAEYIKCCAVQRRCTQVEVNIYKKRNGEYFLHCVSHPNTFFQPIDFLTEKKYVDMEHYKHVNGKFIIPLADEDDINYWLN